MIQKVRPGHAYNGGVDLKISISFGRMYTGSVLYVLVITSRMEVASIVRRAQALCGPSLGMDSILSIMDLLGWIQQRLVCFCRERLSHQPLSAALVSPASFGCCSACSGAATRVVPQPHGPLRAETASPSLFFSLGWKRYGYRLELVTVTSVSCIANIDIKFTIVCKNTRHTKLQLSK
jgi:hypothetical protein